MLNKKPKIKVSSYSLEPKNPLLKEILYVIIILAVLLSIGGFVYYSKPSPEEPPKLEISATQEKARILSRINISNIGDKPLSAEEKKEIYDKVSGTKIQDFNFSKEETFKLLKALDSANNKK